MNDPVKQSSFLVTLVPQQWTFAVDAGELVLNAARRQGIAMPKSCRNGTCRACICLMTSGAVHYTIDWPGLSLDEKVAGYVLPCVACADDNLVIEAPGAKRADPVRP
jgi:ferredoxin